jgi:RNA polymerase sigma-70 factor, ECF subfamily
MPVFRWQAETIRNVGNRICQADSRNGSNHMGTTIRERAYVSSRRERELKNRSADFSSFGDAGQREEADLELDKTLNQPGNAVTALGASLRSTQDSDVAFFGGELHDSRSQDDFEESVGSPGHESSAQEAEGVLIDRILSGHKELFVDLIRPHQRTVYATVFSLLANKEDAEDVTQETLLKGLARLKQFRRESTFGTWLIQIAINEARMRNRKQWRVPMLSINHNKKDDEKPYIPRDFEDWREIPSAALERAEIREVLVKALGSLAQHYREAFVLRDIQELSISETSAILGISPGAVKTRLRRARLMLRDMLAPGLGQDGQLGWVSKEVRKPWE